VEERWVEATAVEVDGIRPRAAEVGSGDDIIMTVLERSPRAFHIGIDEIIESVRVADLRGPDAAVLRVSPEVHLIGEGIGFVFPVNEIA